MNSQAWQAEKTDGAREAACLGGVTSRQRCAVGLMTIEPTPHSNHSLDHLGFPPRERLRRGSAAVKAEGDFKKQTIVRSDRRKSALVRIPELSRTSLEVRKVPRQTTLHLRRSVAQ
jgi:hypothetical protein